MNFGFRKSVFLEDNFAEERPISRSIPPLGSITKIASVKLRQRD